MDGSERLSNEACSLGNRCKMKVSQLFIYPIKSCRGLPVSEAAVSNTGFRYDRLYMLVERKKAENGKIKHDRISMREFPRMGLISTEIRHDETDERNSKLVVAIEGRKKPLLLPLTPR
jgi:uncharacterized protein YcbX